MGSIFRATAGGLVLLAVSACSGSESGAPARGEAARAADTGPLAAAHEGFLDALRAADADAAVAHMDPSAELVLFPMGRSARLEGPEEAARGLGAMLRAVGPAEWTVVHVKPVVHGKSAWITYHFAVEPAGAEPMLGRGTEVWAHGPEGWRLKHGHWSAEPDGA